MKDKDLTFFYNALIAHRGLFNVSQTIPENSTLSFIKAIEKNYPIELDVHILKDGNIIVFHDDNIERMTGINLNLKNVTYEEIKNLRLKNTHYTIPLLSHVLEQINGKVPLIIELKMDQKVGLLETKLAELLDNYKGVFAIQSFDPRRVLWFYKHRPHYIRGQLATNYKNIKNPLALRKLFLSTFFFNRWTKPDYICYDLNGIPNKYVEYERKKGLPLLIWTISNSEELKKAKQYGDGFICQFILK